MNWIDYLQLVGGPYSGWRVPTTEDIIYVSKAGKSIGVTTDSIDESAVYYRKGDKYYSSDQLKMVLDFEAYKKAIEDAKPPKKIKPPAEYDPVYQPVVDEVLANNPDAVNDFPKSINFLIGMVMKANRSLRPDVVKTVILKSIQKCEQ